MKNLFSLLFLFIIVWGQSILSQNDDKNDDEKHPILTDKYQFGAGVFYPSKTIKISAAGDIPENEIEFGKTFGIDDSEITVFLGFDWRFAKKWKLGVEYFGLSSSGKAFLEEDFHWEDITFKEGTGVKGEVDISIYRAYVGRIITTGKKHEFGGGIGAHTMSVKAFIAAQLNINDDEYSGESSSKSITLPLPNLGLWYYYTPTPKLALIARLDVFAISIGEFSGSLWDVAPGVQYQFFKNFGAALNYRYIKLNAGFDSTDWTGDLNIIFQGPSFTVTGNF